MDKTYLLLFGNKYILLISNIQVSKQKILYEAFNP